VIVIERIVIDASSDMEHAAFPPLHSIQIRLNA